MFIDDMDEVHVFLGMARAEELAQVVALALLPLLVQKYKY